MSYSSNDVRVFDLVVDRYGGFPAVPIVVECSDVARWILAEDQRDTFTSDDLPNCAPPFPYMFAEYSHPGCINIGGRIQRDEVGSGLRIGVCSVYGHPEFSSELSEVIGTDVGLAVDRWMSEFSEVGLKWICLQTCYFFKGTEHWQPLHRITGISASGRLSCTHQIFFHNIPSSLSDEATNSLNETVCTVTNVAHLAVSFMHCKNVTLQEGPQANRATRKRYHRKGQELTRYYTLNIQPMKKVLRGKGRADEVGIGKALHICRGHFATYTEDNPLFGRPGAIGQFWVPMHTRGSRAHGEVRKDYRLHISGDCQEEPA